MSRFSLRLAAGALLVCGVLGALVAAQRQPSYRTQRLYSVAEVDRIVAHSRLRWGGRDMLVRGVAFSCYVGFCRLQPMDLWRVGSVYSAVDPQGVPTGGPALSVLIVAPPRDGLLHMVHRLPLIGRYLPGAEASPIFPSSPANPDERTGVFRLRFLAHPVCSRYAKRFCYSLELFDEVVAR